MSRMQNTVRVPNHPDAPPLALLPSRQGAGRLVCGHACSRRADRSVVSHERESGRGSVLVHSGRRFHLVWVALLLTHECAYRRGMPIVVRQTDAVGIVWNLQRLLVQPAPRVLPYTPPPVPADMTYV